MEPKVSTNP